MSNQEYLSTLNESQLKAVQSIDGPNLVIAGAGTGKTRVLTTRVAHIIDTQNAFPSQILCVTFTNKAAREMSDRIQKLVDNKLERMPWMGTFHSIDVNFANFMNLACQLQNSLGGGGFASIHMGENADIAIASQVFHVFSLNNVHRLVHIL